MYGLSSARQNYRLNTHSVISMLSKKPIAEIAFDSRAHPMQKHSEKKMKSEAAMHLARLKKKQCIFKIDGPAIITEEAPGFPISKSQNKKFRRIVLHPSVQKPNKNLSKVQESKISKDVTTIRETIETQEQSDLISNNVNLTMQTTTSRQKQRDKSRADIDQSTISRINDSRHLQDEMAAAAIVYDTPVQA